MSPAERPIALVTGQSPALGSGHLQRMLALLWHLTEIARLDAVLVSNAAPDAVPPDLRVRLRARLPDRASLVIRDMRDSTPEEIESLSRHGPVLAIDDAGPGRARARFAMDLLPNPTTGACEPEAFIYGRTFVDSLRALVDSGPPDIVTDIDCAIYPGAADDAHIAHLLSLMPRGSRCAVLRGAGSYLVRDGIRETATHRSYAHLLLSSQALLSHFGISLYEAHAAGCGLIALNPTPYHARLADLARPRLPIENLGVAGHRAPDEARARIADCLRASTPRIARSVVDRYRTIMSHMDAAVRIIRACMDDR